jgi:hypothetical protein
MPLETSFIGPQRRSDDGVDYLFRVSDGAAHRDVAVGVTGQAINPVGQPARTREVLIVLAEAWLNDCIRRGFNPFSEPSQRVPDVTAMIADHWCVRGELPS